MDGRPVPGTFAAEDELFSLGRGMAAGVASGHAVFELAPMGAAGEDIVAPAQDEEFVISHSDNVQATGFVEHLKLPHYVDFQAELDLVRRMRREYEAAQNIDLPEAAE